MVELDGVMVRESVTQDFDFRSNVSQDEMREVLGEKDKRLSSAKKVIEIEKRYLNRWVMFFTLLLVLSQAVIQFVNAIQDGPPWSAKVTIAVCSAYALVYEGLMKKLGIEEKAIKLKTLSSAISKLRAETQTHLTGITNICAKNMYHVLSSYSSILGDIPVIRKHAVQKFKTKHPEETLPDSFV